MTDEIKKVAVAGLSELARKLAAEPVPAGMVRGDDAVVEAGLAEWETGYGRLMATPEGHTVTLTQDAHAYRLIYGDFCVASMQDDAGVEEIRKALEIADWNIERILR